MKAEGYLAHSDIVEMAEGDLVDEYERFAEYVEKKNEAQKEASKAR